MLSELSDRWHAWRNRLLANDRFQSWALRFWPTRLIANRRAAELFDICAGFVYSQTLFACVRAGVFEHLRAGPQTAAMLSSRSDLSIQATTLLLDAGAALQLFERRRGGRFGLGVLGAAMLGNPGVAAMVEHHALFYHDLEDPIALLRGANGPTKLGGYWSYAANAQPSHLSDNAVSPYTALMSASQPMIAREVLAAFSFAGHRALLDVGGGDGTFLTAIAQAAPHLRVTLFDLPPVAAQAQARFDAEGLSSRTTAIGGSFLTDSLPGDADVVSLVRVLHDHNDDAVMRLLRAVRQAIGDKGALLIAEPMSGCGAQAVTDAYFAFYLLAMGQGRPRSAAQLEHMLQAAGFSRVQHLSSRMPLAATIIVARP